MRAFFERLRRGLWSGVLALGLVLVLGGVVAVDRALMQGDREQAALDAVESAALIESSLRVQVQALNAFHGLFVVPEPAAGRPSVSAERFETFVSALRGELPAFRRVWLADSSGTVLHDRLFREGPAMPRPLDLDTTSALGLAQATRRVRETGRPQLSPPGRLFSGDTGVYMIVPLAIGDRLVGFAGGSITSRSVLDPVILHARRGRRGMAVLAQGDTVAALGARGGATRTRALADVRTPSGPVWTVEVTHQARYAGIRVLLWVLGVGALVAMLVGLLHEGRQKARMAERSRELEGLSAELLQANRAKSEFLANVSHELRTPLNAIVGFVELLRDGVYGELAPRQVAPVERIAGSANHLRHLVDQILDLGKMAAGRLEVYAEPIDLRPFVLNVASEVEPLITEKSLSMSIAIGGTLPRVRTDSTHLRQILVNLLGNAVKYTRTGGIAVRARLVGAGRGTPAPAGRSPSPESALLARRAPKPGQLWIALQVADTGIGIAAADQERIFEEFEQVNAGPRGDSAQRGTGLGLAISRRLARLLGGDISVESDLGKGSTFTVWLPVDPADVRADPGPTPALGLPRIQG